MAGVMKPSHYLPGQTFPFKPDGRLCDVDGCDCEARHAIVTEADSMGGESIHVCTPHFLGATKAREEQRKLLKHCDFCPIVCENVQPVRSPEEGPNGRIYNACPECRITILTPPDPDDDEDDEVEFTPDFRPGGNDEDDSYSLPDPDEDFCTIDD